MNLAFLWQGYYAASMKLQDPGMPVDPTNPLCWTPVAGATYLVMAQSTVSVSNSNEYTGSVEWNITDDMSNVVLNAATNEPLVPQTSSTKVASGGPNTTPMAYLLWQCPSDWPVGQTAYFGMKAGGHDGELNPGEDSLSIAIAELDQAPVL